MNHRERVLTTLGHKIPDRVPIDFGGTGDSAIAAVSYQALRANLHLRRSVTRVSDIYQQTALIEDDVRQALGADVLPILNEPASWRPGTLSDGSPAELPELFRPVILEDGTRLIVDADDHVIAKMPARGWYYDPVYAPLADATGVGDVEKQHDTIRTFDTPSYLDMTYEQMAAKARMLRETTDYALVGFFGGHILQAGQILRGWERFLMDLLVERRLAHAIMEKLVEANLERLERFTRTVGPFLDVVHFEEDLGMQDRPLMSPKTFRTMLKPYLGKLFGYCKAHCDAYLLLHTDGAVAPFIGDLIDMGVDALNPVQVSAAGMDSAALKKQYGQDIVFWGGGCDSQVVLPFGTPGEVEAEVRRRIDDLAPEGGFVFAPIHNIQPGVPIENVLTMFRVAGEHGVYRA